MGFLVLIVIKCQIVSKNMIAMEDADKLPFMEILSDALNDYPSFCTKFKSEDPFGILGNGCILILFKGSYDQGQKAEQFIKDMING